MSQPIVVWRDRLTARTSATDFAEQASLYGLVHNETLLGSYWDIPTACPFCQTEMRKEGTGDLPHIEVTKEQGWCEFCGYHHSLVSLLHFTAWDMREELGAGNVKEQLLHVPVIKSFDLNDPQIAFNELGAWIARHPDKIQSLTHRRFEELVEDVFKSMGYGTPLTQFSKDGGVDIYLVERDGSQAIVQVKHSEAHNKLGVSLVNEVRGLKLQPVHKDVVKAYIVTSSSFTRGAKALASESPIITKFETELVDCQRLLSELGSYNADIANLPSHVREYIIQRQRALDQ